MSWSDAPLFAQARRAVAASLLLIGLAGCGFHPLYATDPAFGGAGQALDQIVVGAVLEKAQPRTAQLVHNALLDQINPDGKPLRPVYSLHVELTEILSEMAVTQSDQVTRNSLMITAAYTLSDIKTGLVLHGATMRATTSFSVMRLDYGNVVAERTARQWLAQELAEKIHAELGAWLMRPGAPVK